MISSFRSFLQPGKLHLVVLWLEKLQANFVYWYSNVNALLEILADRLSFLKCLFSPWSILFVVPWQTSMFCFQKVMLAISWLDMILSLQKALWRNLQNVFCFLNSRSQKRTSQKLLKITYVLIFKKQLYEYGDVVLYKREALVRFFCISFWQSSFHSSDNLAGQNHRWCFWWSLVELCSWLTSFEYTNAFLKAIEKSVGSYYMI